MTKAHALGQGGKAAASRRSVAAENARPANPDAEVGRVGQALVRWWLLLLLAEAPSYGYELSGALHAVGVCFENPYVYHTLRRLEESGNLVSQWQVSDGAGPPRRVYQITTSGRSTLDAYAAQAAALAGQLRRYQRSYAQIRDQPRADNAGQTY